MRIWGKNIQGLPQAPQLQWRNNYKQRWLKGINDYVHNEKTMSLEPKEGEIVSICQVVFGQHL
jgi:hypothetical protein